MSAPPHIALTNHKGGQGRSELTKALACAAAEAGHRVLVIDMDAQANLTRRLQAQLVPDLEQRAAHSLASVLLRPARGEIERVLVPCGYGGIYTERITIAPGHLELELLARTAAEPSSEKRLLRSLIGVVDGYDLVLIDCPPNLLGHLIDIAWTASDLVLVPTEPEYDGVEAARRVRERIYLDRDLLNPDLELLGFIVNRYRQSLGVHQKRAAEVATIAGPEAACPIRVPELSVFKTSSENAQPLTADTSTQGRNAVDLIGQVYQWTRNRAAALMNTEVNA